MRRVKGILKQILKCHQSAICFTCTISNPKLYNAGGCRILDNQLLNAKPTTFFKLPSQFLAYHVTVWLLLAFSLMQTQPILRYLTSRLLNELAQIFLSTLGYECFSFFPFSLVAGEWIGECSEMGVHAFDTPRLIIIRTNRITGRDFRDRDLPRRNQGELN